MEEEFDILACKVLAREATSEETARFQQMRTESPQLQAEFEAMSATWAALMQLAPMAEAIDAEPAEAPPERLQIWRKAVAEEFNAPVAVTVAADRRAQDSAPQRTALRKGSRVFPFALAALCVAAAFAVIALFPRNSSTPIAYLVGGQAEVRRNGKTLEMNSAASLRRADQIRLPRGTSASFITSKGPVVIVGPRDIPVRDLPREASGQTSAISDSVRMALFTPPQQMTGLVATRRGTQSIPIYSPAGFTANLTPAVVWKSDPGKTYDLSITDELTPKAPPLRRTGVVSPVTFSNAWPGRALAKDGLYRIRIAETGKQLTASELTFRTLPSSDGPLATNTPDKLMTAYNLVTLTPSRLGDALTELLSLPPQTAQSELALRLKLLAFAQLGYAEDFDATLLQLKSKR
jgi:hypothetical protein